MKIKAVSINDINTIPGFYNLVCTTSLDMNPAYLYSKVQDLFPRLTKDYTKLVADITESWPVFTYENSNTGQRLYILITTRRSNINISSEDIKITFKKLKGILDENNDKYLLLDKDILPTVKLGKNIIMKCLQDVFEDTDVNILYNE